MSAILEGCTAPKRDVAQLHAAVVETHHRWTTPRSNIPPCKTGIRATRTARAGSIISSPSVLIAAVITLQGDVDTGRDRQSAVTWKYPSCVLRGDNSQASFIRSRITNNHQQADTGTKMIHNGKNTRSTIISKGISAGKSSNTYRGLVRVGAGAENVRNFTQCDSLLLGDQCSAHTVPYIEVKNPTAQIEHEATTSKISDDQMFYAQQRGLDAEEAVSLIVNGFAKDVLKQLPMEFAVEAKALLEISLEGSVG